MTKDQIIVDLTKKLYKANKTVKEYKQAQKEIGLIIYGMGAPLNDNLLGYTKEQLVPFSRIATIMDVR
jgi:hypothetical protein